MEKDLKGYAEIISDLLITKKIISGNLTPQSIAEVLVGISLLSDTEYWKIFQADVLNFKSLIPEQEISLNDKGCCSGDTPVVLLNPVNNVVSVSPASEVVKLMTNPRDRALAKRDQMRKEREDRDNEFKTPRYKQ